jgi:hypothetical protein
MAGTLHGNTQRQKEMFPLVYVHRSGINPLTSSFDWFERGIAITRHFNPDATIIAITDERCRHLLSKHDINFIDIDSIADEPDACNFSNSYVHYSVNDLTYERLCLERWFLLYSALKRIGVKRFAYIDSDNVFLTAVQKVTAKFDSVNLLTHVGKMSAWFLLMDTYLLEEFCSFVKLLYTYKPALIGDWVNYIARRYSSFYPYKNGEHTCLAPHISDMYLWMAFQDLNDIQQDPISPSIFRHARSSIYTTTTLPGFTGCHYNNPNFNFISHVPAKPLFDNNKASIEIYALEQSIYTGYPAPKDGWYKINNLHLQGTSKLYVDNIYKLLCTKDPDFDGSRNHSLLELVSSGSHSTA